MRIIITQTIEFFVDMPLKPSDEEKQIVSQAGADYTLQQLVDGWSAQGAIGFAEVEVQVDNIKSRARL